MSVTAISVPRDVDVVVVGSGPNGLVAARDCARAGRSVLVLEAQETLGGGSRTLPVDHPAWDGLVVDPCAAVHPLAAASPALSGLDVELVTPPVALAHALPRRAAIVVGGAPGKDGAGNGDPLHAWRRVVEPLARDHRGMAGLLLSDQRSASDPRAAARFAAAFARARLPGGVLHPGTTSDSATLASGIAAHAICDLRDPAATAVALALGALLHSPHGWPIPRGGSGAITGALAAEVRAFGGRIETGRPVHSINQLLDPRRPDRHVVLTTTASDAAGLLYGRHASDRKLAERNGERAWRMTRRVRPGGGVAKVDVVLRDDIPWLDPRVALAGTVHLGGTAAEIRRAEHAVARGKHADQPVVLAAQPWVADPGRIATDGRRPLWAYAHVPYGSPRDVSELVLSTIEAAAPGFRDVVVATRCTPASQMDEHNANLTGGDIAGGAATLRGLIERTTRGINPYLTGVPGVWLASASTVPGPGVHGMAGHHVARRILHA